MVKINIEENDAFHNCKEYLEMKSHYEKKYFKLFGDYCWYDGDKIVEKSASNMGEHFVNKTIKILIEENKITAKKKTTDTVAVRKSFFDVWRLDPNIREYMEVVFNCNLKEVKPYQFNLFTGFNHFDNLPIVDVNLEPVFEHIRTLTNYDEEMFKYVLSWIAQIIQQPETLPHTALIFISDEGVGKDTFSNFISNVINKKFTTNTDKLEQLVGKFNSTLAGKLLLTINETNPVESRERLENIKFLITAEDLNIEKKCKDIVRTKNYARLMFFSNKLTAFPVDENARRPVIMKCSNRYTTAVIGSEKNKEYFTNLRNIMNDEKYQYAFLRFLKSYDISNFIPSKVKKSELHKDLEELSKPPLIDYFNHIVMSNGDDDIVKMLTTDTLKEVNTFMREQGMKYDITAGKLGLEFNDKYKNQISKYKSNGYNYFKFHIPAIKKLLVEKYGYVYDGEVITNTPIEIENEKLKEENKQLKDELEALKKEMNDIREYNKTLLNKNNENIIEKKVKKVKNVIIDKVKPVIEEQPQDIEITEEIEEPKNESKKKKIDKSKGKFGVRENVIDNRKYKSVEEYTNKIGDVDIDELDF